MDTDNIPAFPCEQHETLDGAWNQTFEPGMSLRDYFAGQALVGWLARDEPEKRSYPQEAAYEAYQYADAMIAERGGAS